MVITELRQEFKLKLLLAIAKMPKSSYYYYRRGLKLPSKYALIKDKLRQLHRENNNSFGYRRMRILLKDNGILLNHKTVLRLMNQINISGKVESGLITFNSLQTNEMQYLDLNILLLR